jgi:hypothetical protein
MKLGDKETSVVAKPEKPSMSSFSVAKTTAGSALEWCACGPAGVTSAGELTT